MSMRLLAPSGCSVIGLAIGLYLGVWVAGFVERAYAPVASGSDELDAIFLLSMGIACITLGALFALMGYRLGKYFLSEKAGKE